MKGAMLTLSMALMLSFSLPGALAQTIGGAVYGGGRMADVTGDGTVTVKSTSQSSTDAQLKDPSFAVPTDQGVGSVYGGNDIAGRLWGATTVTINGGVVRNNVFGGGNGDYGCTNDWGNLYASGVTYDDGGTNVVLAGKAVPVAWKANVTIEEKNSKKVYVCGAVYGGGNKAEFGVKAVCSQGSDTISTTADSLSCTGWRSSVNEISSTIHLVSGVVHNVYGGGRMAPIYGISTIDFPSTSTIYIPQNVFAGNDIATTKAASDISAGVVNVQGAPTIQGSVFGGANGDYDYTDTAIYPLNHASTDAPLADLTCQSGFCDDAKLVSPTMQSGTVNVAMAATGHIGTIFGGGNAANIAGATLVTVTSGDVDVIYGGCNKSNVGGTVTVNLPTGGTATVDTIYGGNNISGTITGNVAVNLNGSTVNGNVFAGSNGDYGCNDGAEYTDGRYEDMRLPVISGTATINAEGSNLANATLYGGGNMAPTTGNSTLNIKSGNILDVYGGGRMAPVTSSSIVFDNGYTGTIRNVYGGNDIANTATAVANSETSVTIQGDPNITGAVYGGGNGAYRYAYDGNIYNLGGTTPIGKMCSGMVKPGVKNSTVTVDMKSGYTHSIAAVYGGCNAADVSNNTTVTLTNGTVGVLYGGNNISGDIAGTSTVNLNDGIVTGNVFGGSNGDYGCVNTDGNYNGGDYDGLSQPTSYNTVVTLDGTTVKNIYGAGNKASVGGAASYDGNTHVILNSGEVTGCAYAGGRMASVNGFATIETTTGLANTSDELHVAAIYGGNDIAGAVNVSNTMGARTPATAIDGTALNYDNAASYVKIAGHPVVGMVFGGGNGDYIYTSPTAIYQADPDGGTILITNQRCNAVQPVQTSAFVDIDLAEGGVITSLYGGANAVPIAKATTHITGESSHGIINTAYAGGNKATVTESANLLLNASAGSMTTGSPDVNTIFAGNNLADMDILPTLTLTSGTVKNVYGGGNQGNMEANEMVDGMPNISTLVEINNSNIAVRENIYGGCRAADVQNPANNNLGGTYVKMSAGTVNNIFGGNDIAGVAHNAHVSITGGTVAGNVYGGSNGMYSYVGNSVYPFGQTSGSALVTYDSPVARASIDSSSINITGGTFEGNIYGGGLAGDGIYAYTNINGATVKLNGQVFGAGCGNTAAIGQCVDHLGNVKHSRLELYQIDESNSTINTVYGGGHAGDADSTDLIIDASFNKRLTYVYGGGYAGHITGLAYTHIQGKAGVQVADTVYGGNNYAGYVDSTDLNVVEGTYHVIYGAGNGAYVYGNTICDSVPYSNVVLINLGDPATTYAQNNNLTVRGNVYGGGNLGVVRKFNYSETDPTNSLANVMQNDNDVTNGEYGSIVINVFNGNFKNHIFSGARGRETNDARFGGKVTYGRHQLAFAFKEVNTYNCLIDHSLYGGSEAVDDGYPWEFGANKDATTNAATATLSPTSVLNIMGGRIQKNVYGGGYLGDLYGSVYVNVGVKAVDSCYVWTRDYSNTGNGSNNNLQVAFAGFKPDLEAHDIYLQASVYNGSDWGEAGANAVFNTRGFYGGESHIFVDGKGYNTGLNTSGTTLPALDIVYSLIGSGTSTSEGDCGGKIIVRHYGEEGCPTPSKDIFTIQRTGVVLLDSVFIDLLGEQDAYLSYASPNYTFNRIDTLILRGHNTVLIENPAVYIGAVRSEVAHGFFEPNTHPNRYEYSTLQGADLANNAVDCSTPGDDFCLHIQTAHKDNKLIMLNGIFLSVLPYVETYEGGDHSKPLGVNGNTTYGPIEGYMFFVASADGTLNYVYAREKDLTPADDIHPDDGGFMGICISDNQFTGNNYADPTTTQLPYTNATKTSGNYRVWSVGSLKGDRNRAVSLVANSNVDAKLCNDAAIQGTAENGYNKDMGVAHATLDLPPSQPGNFYAVKSVVIDADNGGQIRLVSAAFDSTGTDRGVWKYASNLNASEHGSEIAKIDADPNYTFGLYFGCGTNFGTSNPNGVDANKVVDGTVVVGGANFEALDGYYTKAVAFTGTDGIIPTLDFELTYSRNFNSTIIREVTMEIMEYESVNTGTADVPGWTVQEVGPVNITVTLSTVIDRLKDMDITLMAMYNEGKNNTFNRLVVLPATFQRRTLYLDNVEWYPDPWCTRDNIQAASTAVISQADMTAAAGKFQLTSADAPKTTPNLFGISVELTENITDNIANSLGWYDITTRSFDLNDTIRRSNTVTTNPPTWAPDANGSTPVATPVSTYKYPDALVSHTITPDDSSHITRDSYQWDANHTHPNPINVPLGVLDGRATAGINVTLHYNGTLLYPKDDTLGFAVLHLHYTDAGSTTPQYFDIRIRVKSRLAGDTIYLASKKNGFYRGPAVASGTTPDANFVEAHGNPLEDPDYGKRPMKYVTKFTDALDLYQEGDVIAVIDTVIFNTGDNLTVNGADFWKLQVIRYSGSHDDAPGQVCAYRGPLFCLRGDASFGAYDCWFNGSGSTRVKRQSTDTERTNFNSLNGSLRTNPVLELTDSKSNRLYDTIWAEAPMFVVEDGATLTFLRNCEVSNNYSKVQKIPDGVTMPGTSYSTTPTYSKIYLPGEHHDTTGTCVNYAQNGNVIPADSATPVAYHDTTIITYPTLCYYPGGAVGLYRTKDNKTPKLRMGNNVTIHHNAILANTVNRGAAIYNNDGTIQLGMTTDGGDVVDITHNYALPLDETDRAASFQLINSEVMWGYAWTDTSGYHNTYFAPVTLPLLSLDTTLNDGNGLAAPTGTKNVTETFTSRKAARENVATPINGTLSNVFLTRLRRPAPSAGSPYLTYEALNDKQTDLVSFNTTLGAKTRVGIHKWFPGTNYTPSTSDPLCRDTIQISRLTNTRYLYAQLNFNNRIFFDDSTTSYVFYHSTVSPMNIYFQRCATFKQRTLADERTNANYVLTRGDTLVTGGNVTEYHINRDSKCSAILDTLQYRVQGGFYPYSYTWQCSPAQFVANGNYYVPVGVVPSTGASTSAPIDWDNLTNAPIIRERKDTLIYDNSIADVSVSTNEAKRLLASVDTCGTSHLALMPTIDKAEFVYRVVAYDLTDNCPLPKEIDIRVVRTDDNPYTNSTDAMWMDKSSISVPNPGVDSNHIAHIGYNTNGTNVKPAEGDSTRTRYLRLSTGVHLDVKVAPSWQDGYVDFQAIYLQGPLSLQANAENHYVINNDNVNKALKSDFFCPGDVLNISTFKTKKADSVTNLTNSTFMMWDFDPQALAENVVFTMPDHDYSIKAIYSPSQHWYEVVNTSNGSFDCGAAGSQTPGYSVDYDGNVTISNEAGLAWLISTTNGLNYQNPTEFHNKKITIAPKADGTAYDMSAYLWTPLGTQTNPFSGNFQGQDAVIKGIICIEPNLTYVGFFGNVGHDNPGTVIGQTATATLNQVHLDNATFKGNNYVGGIAAVVNDGSKVTKNTVTGASLISGAYMVGGIAAQANGKVVIDQNVISSTDFIGNATYTGAIVAEDVEVPGNATETMECGNPYYFSGERGLTPGFMDGESFASYAEPGQQYEGPCTIYMIDSVEQPVDGIQVFEGQVVTVHENADVIEDPTVEGGQIVRIGWEIVVCTRVLVGSEYTNNTVEATTIKMQSSGVEGTIGTSDNGNKQQQGFFSRLFGKRKPSAVPQAYLANNYVEFRTSGQSLVAGGLMGSAANISMVNNYVYGEVASQNNAGALVGYVGNNVSIDRCYYQDGTSVSGAYGGGKQPKNGYVTTSFSGSGNRVRMATPGYGNVTNLTRALNDWALAQQRYGDTTRTINTWRSDLNHSRDGLPLFGQPDIIEVVDSTINSVCDSYEWQGETMNASAVFAVRVIDTIRYIDSVMYYRFDLGHSQHENVLDSIEAGNGYQGHGFNLSAEELDSLVHFENRELFRTIELVDSLLTAHGCDSIVRLSLTVYATVGIDEVEDDTTDDDTEVLFEVSVYPNPTLGAITVESSQLRSVEVYDGISRLVTSRTGLQDNSVQLDLSPYSSGVYYLRITTAHGVAIKKVVKK